MAESLPRGNFKERNSDEFVSFAEDLGLDKERGFADVWVILRYDLPVI